MTTAADTSTKPVWLLSTALSRLSQLQGIYLEAHQFHTDDNNALITNATSIWLRIHPQGEVIQLSNAEQLTQHIKQIGGLWVDTQKSSIRLIRGIGLDRQMVIETPEGQLEYENINHLLETGNIFLFISQAKQINNEELVTATDWFLHGVAKKIREIKDGIIATFVMNILAVGTAIYSMQVYDRVVPSESRSTLIVLTIGVFFAIGFELLMKVLRAKLIDQTFKEVDLELSSVFFNKALGIRLDARPKNVGTFISEIRQFESIRGFMTATTLFVLADAPFTLFFIVVMAFIGGYLSVIPVIFLVIMLVLGIYMSQKLKETNQKIIEEANRKNGFLIEAMDGIESIKASSGETQILQNWQDMTQSQAQRELQLKEVTTNSQAYAASLQQIAYVCTVAMGALLIQKGELSMGGLIGCTILTGRILGPLTQIPQLLVQWGQIKVSLASLNNIMTLPSDQDNTTQAVIPETSKANIRMENVSFGYDQDQKTILVDRLQLQGGQFVVVMGRVGSGKSTLIKLISGLFRPNDGRVFLDEIDISHIAKGYVRSKIGYLPQDVRLVKGTLKDNLVLGLPYSTDSQIFEAASRVGLDRLIKRHPAGINLPILEGGLGLSGGQRQMVALARLFLAQPQIMLLDEPTSSLDGELETHVLEELHQYANQDRLMMVVSHKPTVLQHASHLMIIDNGKISEYGPRDQVIEKMKQRSRPSVRNIKE